jgi:hypothetical protein
MSRQLTERRLAFLLIISTILLIPSMSTATWWADVPIETDPAQTSWGDLVADGAGGYIAVWYDFRGADIDIYAQKVDDGGDRHWEYNGRIVCGAAGDQSSPAAVADGSGGVIIVWLDYRTGAEGVYAQHLDIDGVAQWATDGLRVSVNSLMPIDMKAVSDGAGGVIAVWEETAGIYRDIMAQRVNGSGAHVWVTDVILCNAPNLQYYLSVVADGEGGAIVSWLDYRDGTANSYAQRVDALGALLWAGNGAVVCAHSASQNPPVATSDGAGGGIFVWTDERGADADIYGQRITGPGLAEWAPDGIPVLADTADQWDPAIISDGAGGAYVTWTDGRFSTDRNVWAQHIDPGGNGLWQAAVGISGIPVGAFTDREENARLISDGAGGVVVAWDEWQFSNYDVRAQRLNKYGISYWGSSGSALASYGGLNQQLTGLVSNGNHGCLIVFSDDRNGGSDLYAMRADGRRGDLGRPDPPVGPVLDVPFDQGGYVSVNWMASDYDVMVNDQVSHYSVWRAVTEIPGTGGGTDGSEALKTSGGDSDPRLVTLPDVTVDFPGPGFRVEHTPAGDFYWEWVGNQNAYTLLGYSMTVPTTYDSTGADPAVHHFQVIAHGIIESVYWISAPHPGYSVDNLPPGTPLFLNAWRDLAVLQLAWNPAEETDPDFSHYAVHRSENPGVPPDGAHFLLATTETGCEDLTAVYSKTYYYVVTAADIHGNNSEVSNEVEVENIVTAIGDSPVPKVFAVLPNVPNPFTAGTELRFDLPQRADVTIELFDVKGRRVSSRVLSDVAPGRQSVRFSGRDAAGRLLPSGVYFYRISVPGAVQVRKMVITR